MVKECGKGSLAIRHFGDKKISQIHPFFCTLLLTCQIDKMMPYEEHRKGIFLVIVLLFEIFVVVS